MAKEPLIILGSGGNTVDFFDTIASNYNIIGIVDDDKSKHGTSYNNVPIGDRSILVQYPEAKIISLIGSEKTFQFRNKIIEDFDIDSNRFATAIHPKAIIGSNAEIGYDVVIMPGVVITSNTKVGNHIFILGNTILHHDTEVGDYTVIGSNVTLAGHVKIGSNCFIGSSTSVMNNLVIGNNSIIGMGSNVTKDVPPNSKCVGNPAKNIEITTA